METTTQNQDITTQTQDTTQPEHATTEAAAAEQTRKEIKRFDIKTEAAVLKAVSKIIKPAKYTYTEEEAIQKEDLSIRDSFNNCLINAKTEEAKRVLSRFIENDHPPVKNLSLDYSNIIFKTEKPNDADAPAEEGEQQTSKYLIKYLLPFLKIFESTKEEAVEISLKKDYPATLENKHFKIIVVPRINND